MGQLAMLCILVLKDKPEFVTPAPSLHLRVQLAEMVAEAVFLVG